jgi:DNA polymerase-3 subunit delta'
VSGTGAAAPPSGGAGRVAGLLEQATEHQPRARATLGAALSSGPSHAYLFRGPHGSGKRAAARAFAAEILAGGAEDGEDARRRALLDPSPHPDLVWLAPSGSQHMVEAVRERVIRAASYRPFEGERRVFVVEAAEAMRDESQNALLKTLEEPPGFAHLILLSSEPEALLETVASRCQPVEFAPLPLAVLEATLTDGAPHPADGPKTPAGVAKSAHRQPEEVAAAARLAAGDLERARFLLSEQGGKLRAAELELAAPSSKAPWRRLLKAAEDVGADAEAAARAALEADKEAGLKRSAREITDEAKRSGRRRRTEMLDLGLALCASWFRDMAALIEGADEVVFNRDRLDRLRAAAEGVEAGDARKAAELVQDTRRRLDLNVSEELALEALTSRLERLVG